MSGLGALELEDLRIDGIDHGRESERLAIEIDRRLGESGRAVLHLSDPEGQVLRSIERDLGRREVSIEGDHEVRFRGVAFDARHRRDPQRGGVTRIVMRDPLHRLDMGPVWTCLGQATIREAFDRLANDVGLRLEWGAAEAGRLADAQWNLVIYGESPLAMLLRHAASIGAAVFCDGDSLVCAPVPVGDEAVEVEVSDGVDAFGRCTRLEWGRRASGGGCGWWMPIAASPLEGAPVPATDHRGGGSESGDSGSDWRRRAVLPHGLAIDASAAAELGSAVSAFRRAIEDAGVMTLDGAWQNLPRLQLGRRVSVRSEGRELWSGIATRLVFKATLEEGCEASVLFGGAGGMPTPGSLEAWPARHVFPAVVQDQMDVRIGSHRVVPTGWATDCQPMVARVLAVAASNASKDVIIRTYHPGELVLIGFEGGNPDFPVILGAMAESQVPPPIHEHGLLTMGRPGPTKAHLRVEDDEIRLESECRLVCESAREIVMNARRIEHKARD